MKNSGRLAIVGAGPIGVEAALRGVEEGYDVAIYEAGRVGEHLRRWEHVPMFSPWRLNRSTRGERRLQRRGLELAPDDACPTAREYRRQYLQPLANSLRDEVEFHLITRVLGISRTETLKGDWIGDDRRASSPFLLRLQTPEEIHFQEADIVIDASGVLSQPNALGPGGLPAIGEDKLNGQIMRQIPDLDGEDHRAQLRGQRVLLVGHGHSALTTLDLLRELRRRQPSTEVVWAFRAHGEPRDVIDDDPLAERARLDRFGNTAARGEVDGIEPLSEATVRRLEEREEGIEVTLEQAGRARTVVVDRVVANVGYRPDISLSRELQIHLCYASDGPMNLAASLLSASGGDCLDQPSGGAETLENPEPNFYILGAKSYGRNPNFLLQTGFQQLDTIFKR